MAEGQESGIQQSTLGTGMDKVWLNRAPTFTANPRLPCQSKYVDIWTKFLRQYPVPGGTAYPNKKEAICKTQIASKLKSGQSIGRLSILNGGVAIGE